MNIMVISAHPDLSRSRANRTLAKKLKEEKNLLYRDLYTEYPDWHIDAQKEQRLLLAYDRIVLQFPLYWYSCPPLLKKWFDDVFTFGWAYGTGGDRLRGKEFMIVTAAGGTAESYRSGGDNEFTISELLRPIQRTITKCNGTYLPVFVTYNADKGTDDYLAAEAERLSELIRRPIEALAH
ncbi:NAD(P)H-dependent oxidoreductase [Cohnella thailandensis]|uniref:NAD(P)H-dependent oxidoreductase n=1 Tax=Cohnella thailandensis TaxID=557557 RepID=A0A841T4G9_9BACL|nr:NAD(P)H-dependent oxidoreductase [Cohnella thailandensis]MBB6637736.1 NAD(P)H-dependent oxidoreductase [Cohnella thailandensis]MBP1974087.1 glutathione-regulated potassium-efflux system ancillary protein KefG [Cohnella thailandensis]